MILKSEDNIDCAVQNLTITIQKAVRESTPDIRSLKSKTLLPQNVIQLFLEKRKLRRILLPDSIRFPDDQNSFNRASQNLKRLLEQIKETCNRQSSHLESYKTL